MRSEDKAMASMPKYQIAAILHDLGFSLSEIASTLYPDEKNRKKAINRANNLLWYLRRKSIFGSMVKSRKIDETDGSMYDGSNVTITIANESRYYPHYDAAPFSDGTLDIDEQKKYYLGSKRVQKYVKKQKEELSKIWKLYKKHKVPYAMVSEARKKLKEAEKGIEKLKENGVLDENEYERQKKEYEELLYFLYNLVCRRVDDSMHTMWLNIKLVFYRTFPYFWKKYHEKYFHHRKRKTLKEATAAYVYLVFFFALWDYHEFKHVRAKLSNIIYRMVKKPEKVKTIRDELMPLFGEYTHLIPSKHFVSREK